MAKLGVNAKLYWRSSGTYEAPTFTEIDLVSDLTVNTQWDKGDASTRESRVKKNVKTMLGLTFSGRLKKKPGHPGYEVVMDAMVSDMVLDLLVLDGDVDADGSRGWRFEGQVFQANEDQSLGNVLFEEIEIEPTVADHEPVACLVDGTDGLQYSDVGGGAPNFS